MYKTLKKLILKPEIVQRFSFVGLPKKPTAHLPSWGLLSLLSQTLLPEFELKTCASQTRDFTSVPYLPLTAQQHGMRGPTSKLLVIFKLRLYTLYCICRKCRPEKQCCSKCRAIVTFNFCNFLAMCLCHSARRSCLFECDSSIITLVWK